MPLELNVPPIFSDIAGSPQMMFQAEPMNYFLSARYNDRFGFFQQQFGVYGYMQLTSELKFQINYVTTSPLILQSHNSCAWTPLGVSEPGQNEIEPCRAKVNVEHCYDTWFGSIFKDFNRWSASGTIGLSDVGQQAVNVIADSVAKAATLGARMNLVAGQLFDATVALKPNTKVSIQEAFARTVGTCQGWLELAATKRANDPTNLNHLDDPNLILPANISVDGKSYTGSVLDLYDATVDASPEPLNNAVVDGGVNGFGDSFYTLFLVSPSILRKLRDDYNTINQSAAVTANRISTETFTIQTDRGSRDMTVWKIDNTYVVPVGEPSQYTQYFDGEYHFAYLTVNGVIQMGTNFAGIPVQNTQDVAMLVEQSNRVKDFNKVYLLSHMLLGVAINDTDYLCGSQLLARP